MSLREKFVAAQNGSERWELYDRDLIKGHQGTVQDFYDRFDSIAAGLKSGMEALIEDIKNGKSIISTPREAYKHCGAPLNFEIVIPAQCSPEEVKILEEKFYFLPGYHKIHEICASADVDMAVTRSWKSSSYQTQNGHSVRYKSIAIQISPDRPYSMTSPDYYPKSRPVPSIKTPKV